MVKIYYQQNRVSRCESEIQRNQQLNAEKNKRKSSLAENCHKIVLSVFSACSMFHRYLYASSDLPHGQNITNLPSDTRKLVQKFQDPIFELPYRIFNDFCAKYEISGDVYESIKKDFTNRLFPDRPYLAHHRSRNEYLELYSKFNDAKKKFKQEMNNVEIGKLIKIIETIDKDISTQYSIESKYLYKCNPYILAEMQFLEFIIGGLARINSDNPKILELKEIALNEKNPIIKKAKISKAILNLSFEIDFDSNLLKIEDFLNSNSYSVRGDPLIATIKYMLLMIDHRSDYFKNTFKKYNIVTLYRAFTDKFDFLNGIFSSDNFNKYRSFYEGDPNLRTIMDDVIKFAVMNDLTLYRDILKYPKKDLYDMILEEIIKSIEYPFPELKNTIKNKIGDEKFSHYLNY